MLFMGQTLVASSIITHNASLLSKINQIRVSDGCEILTRLVHTITDAIGNDHVTRHAEGGEQAGCLLEALNMALWQRQPEAVIHHSDQGCQYTSIAFGLRCCKAGIRPSMGSTGDCYDNALRESFFATFE